MALFEIRKQIKMNNRLKCINDSGGFVTLTSFICSSVDVLSILSVQWSTPPFSIDYKSVTGPVRLMVLVPLLVVIMLGVTLVIVDAFLGFAMNSSVLLLLLLCRIADDPVVIVTTLLLSIGCDLLCKVFKRNSKLQMKYMEKTKLQK